MAGETELGVCTLEMTAGVDEGPVGDARTVHVPRDADAGRAYELLAPAAVERQSLATLDAHGRRHASCGSRRRARPPTRPRSDRPTRRSTGAGRPRQIADQVRALSPHIGAVTELAGRRTRVWRARAGRRAAARRPDRTGSSSPPGRAGWRCSSSSRRAGTRMTAGEFLRGAGRSLLAT